MERLTKRSKNGTAEVAETELPNSHKKLIERLAAYEDAEEQGRLLYPPNGALVVWDVSAGVAKAIPLVNLFVTREGAEEALKS